jgi:EAL domain-containing protein (putative c-di-GMP-specific phosphodiesterase class I)
VDYVKVDARHWVGAGEEAAARSHVEGLVALIHGLDMQAFAEGVADARQLGLVWVLGFDGATGPAVTGSDAEGSSAAGVAEVEAQADQEAQGRGQRLRAT